MFFLWNMYKGSSSKLLYVYLYNMTKLLYFEMFTAVYCH